MGTSNQRIEWLKGGFWTWDRTSFVLRPEASKADASCTSCSWKPAKLRSSLCLVEAVHPSGWISTSQGVACRKNGRRSLSRRLGGLMQPLFCQGFFTLPIFCRRYRRNIRKLEVKPKHTRIDPGARVKVQPRIIRNPPERVGWTPGGAQTPIQRRDLAAWATC